MWIICLMLLVWDRLTFFFFFKGFKFRWFFFQIALLLLPGENQPQQEQISWLEELISKLPDAVMLN